jgi:hypothetical protein
MWIDCIAPAVFHLRLHPSLSSMVFSLPISSFFARTFLFQSPVRATAACCHRPLLLFVLPQGHNASRAHTGHRQRGTRFNYRVLLPDAPADVALCQITRSRVRTWAPNLSLPRPHSSRCTPPLGCKLRQMASSLASRRRGEARGTCSSTVFGRQPDLSTSCSTAGAPPSSSSRREEEADGEVKQARARSRGGASQSPRASSAPWSSH